MDRSENFMVIMVDDMEALVQIVSKLVEAGIGFTAQIKGGRWHIELNGGY